MMDRRLIFPVLMFTLAGLSFVYGTWQYFAARQVAAVSDARTATMIQAIEQSGVARAQKQSLYATIFRDLPPAPALFGIEFSGSFASQDTGDQCTSEGQRVVCRALQDNGADASVLNAVCGLCNPK